MLSKNEYGFLVVTLLAFIFLIIILLFVTLTQYNLVDKDDYTYHEMEFIRYRY
jgi:hypothetical protein